MSVRVRLAPSPTGNLHIGNARTAIYNFLFAKKMQGSFIIRVEDTDLERSTKEFEQNQMEDLQWLGLQADESPANPGEFAPYRQSERLELYKDYAQKLLDEGKAFYDFCSDEELQIMSEKAKSEGTSPYTGKWKKAEHWDEAKSRVAAGEKAPIRFLVPDKAYSFKDYVRGEVKFPAGMVGDFVILRSNGMPTYNFCNVVDDALQKMTHIIRGEDHTNNTLRQLMIYEALDFDIPEFAHVSLLIGEDRQKLSKRHGVTSVRQYREDGYLPEALFNYLCLLGWSHPEEKDVFNWQDIANDFSLTRFSKSHAIYDVEKLKWINGQHIKNMEAEELLQKVRPFIKNEFFHSQTKEWQLSFVSLFQDKVQLLKEFESKINEYVLFESLNSSSELDEIMGWETTPQIQDHVKAELAKIDTDFIQAEDLDSWMNYCKKELKIKGKPLFMGFRGVLTGMNHGPDLKVLVPLTPVSLLKKRLGV